MSFLRRLFGARPEQPQPTPKPAAPPPPAPPAPTGGRPTQPLPPLGDPAAKEAKAPSAPATPAAVPASAPTGEPAKVDTAPAKPGGDTVFGIPEPIITPPPASTDQPEQPAAAPAEPIVKVSTGEFKTSGTAAKPEIIDLTADAFGATRPLAPLPVYQSAPNKHLIYGANSDIGRQRSNNQDAFLTFFSMHVSAESRPDFGVFAVGDGMGGHMEGEKASAIATRVVGQHIIDKLYMEMILAASKGEAPIISEVLTDAVQRANTAVSSQIPEGGTTLTTVVIINDMAYLGHVGDSRAYLVTNDSIEQITRDHSLVQRLIELDQLTVEEAAHHSQKNVLYRAIGQSENLEVDSITRRLPPGVRILICSDGLWGQVPDSQLHEIVRTSATPQEAVDRMIAAANDRGGPDNITAVLIQVPG